MILTRKQQAVVRLVRAGVSVSEIARQTRRSRPKVSTLLSRAKRNLRRAGLDPDKLLSPTESDYLDLVA